MKKIKKCSIGYNTILSTKGVIFTKGVKSKPNSIEVFGFTHEVGEGEKSPDNPYQLISLDSGAMTVDNVVYEHSIKINNNDRMIQVPTPIALNCVEGVSDRIVKKEDGYYYIEQNIQDIIVDKISNIREQKNGYAKFNISIENGKAVTSNKIICDKLLVRPYSHIEDFSREYIRSSMKTYPNILVAYMLTSRFTNNSEATATEVSAYLKDNPLEVLYQVENPYYLRLSDYAQQLLNSFELQNNNEISVEGHPNIEISGYIQK